MEAVELAPLGIFGQTDCLRHRSAARRRNAIRPDLPELKGAEGSVRRVPGGGGWLNGKY